MSQQIKQQNQTLQASSTVSKSTTPMICRRQLMSMARRPHVPYIFELPHGASLSIVKGKNKGKECIYVRQIGPKSICVQLDGSETILRTKSVVYAPPHNADGRVYGVWLEGADAYHEELMSGIKAKKRRELTMSRLLHMGYNVDGCEETRPDVKVVYDWRS